MQRKLAIVFIAVCVFLVVPQVEAKEWHDASEWDLYINHSLENVSEWNMFINGSLSWENADYWNLEINVPEKPSKSVNEAFVYRVNVFDESMNFISNFSELEGETQDFSENVGYFEIFVEYDNDAYNPSDYELEVETYLDNSMELVGSDKKSYHNDFSDNVVSFLFSDDNIGLSSPKDNLYQLNMKLYQNGNKLTYESQLVGKNDENIQTSSEYWFYAYAYPSDFQGWEDITFRANMDPNMSYDNFVDYEFKDRYLVKYEDGESVMMNENTDYGKNGFNLDIATDISFTCSVDENADNYVGQFYLNNIRYEDENGDFQDATGDIDNIYNWFSVVYSRLSVEDYENAETIHLDFKWDDAEDWDISVNKGVEWENADYWEIFIRSAEWVDVSYWDLGIKTEIEGVGIHPDRIINLLKWFLILFVIPLVFGQYGGVDGFLAGLGLSSTIGFVFFDLNLGLFLLLVSGVVIGFISGGN